MIIFGIIRGGTNTSCVTGYEGPLCDVCTLNVESKYYKFGNHCLECPSLTISVLYNVGYILLSMGIVLFTIRFLFHIIKWFTKKFLRSYFKENDKNLTKILSFNDSDPKISVSSKIEQKINLTIFIKIFFNYGKLISFLLSYQSSWILDLSIGTNFFSFFENFSQTFSSYNPSVNPSIDCLLAGYQTYLINMNFFKLQFFL